MGSGGLGCGLKCAKILLFIFNFIFWLCGAALLGLGIWLIVDSSSLSKISDAVAELMDGRDLKAIAYLFIAVGAIIFLVGFCGCCGAIKEIKCLLCLYIMFVALVVIIEVVAVVLGFVYKGQIEDFVKDEGSDFIKAKYNGTQDDASMALNYIQFQFKCCGLKDGPRDYENSNYTTKWSSFPVSPFCCKIDGDYDDSTTPSPVVQLACMVQATGCISAGDCEDKAELNGQSCYDGINDWIKDHYPILIGVALGFAVIQLFGLIFAICLCRAVGKDD